MALNWNTITSGDVKTILKRIQDETLQDVAMSFGYKKSSIPYFKSRIYAKAHGFGIDTKGTDRMLEYDRQDRENHRTRLVWTPDTCEEVYNYIQRHSLEEAADHYNYSCPCSLTTYLRRKIKEYGLDLSVDVQTRNMLSRDDLNEILDAVSYFGAKETAATYGYTVSSLNKRLINSLRGYAMADVEDIYTYLAKNNRLNVVDYKFIGQSDIKYLKLLEEVDKTNINDAAETMGYVASSLHTSLKHIKDHLGDNIFEGNSQLAAYSFWDGKYEKAMNVISEIGIIRTAAAFGFESVEGLSRSIGRYELMIMD